MQRINVAIVNPAFMTAFVGGLAFTIAAAVVHVGEDQRSVLPWILAGVILYVAVLVITGVVNVPLNDDLAAAGDPSRIADLGAVRSHFEGRWVAWNIARTVANVAAFGCLTYALILHGRATVATPSELRPPAATVVMHRTEALQRSSTNRPSWLARTPPPSRGETRSGLVT